MNIFFTGCTHFDHANIIRLANRPFTDVEEMNQTIVDRWNSVVGQRDITYHLGDFGYINKRQRADELLGRLNGNKILIVGNHDEKPVLGSKGWMQVLPYHELKTDGHKLVMFHYPIEEWNGQFKGSIHVHAHTHHGDKSGRFPIENRVNVTVEAWNYTPAPIERVIAFWSPMK